MRWILLPLTLILFAPSVRGQAGVLDHRYAPATWRTGIGWPDDWQKTIVDEGGSLLYDFGPGPYVTPMTTVSFVLDGHTLAPVRQESVSAEAPILSTSLIAGGARVNLTTFAAVPSPETSPPLSGYRRLEGTVGTQGWASPPEGSDPVFRSVAFGTNRPVRYEIDVPPGSSWIVMFGFAEAYRTQPLQRMFNVSAEGSPAGYIDVLNGREQNEPAYTFVRVRDENGDGKLSVEVGSASADPNTYLSGLWLVDPAYWLSAETGPLAEWKTQAHIAINAGDEMAAGQPYRLDVIRMVAEARPLRPIVTIKTGRQMQVAGSALIDAGRMRIETVPAAESVERTDTGWRMVLPEGTNYATAYVWSGTSTPTDSTPDPEIEQERAEQAWVSGERFDDRIEVPDDALQAMLVASVRGVAQAREVVDGHLQYQPGMALYRGLWVHDSAYLVDTALMTGDTTSARRAIEGILTFQRDDGQVLVSRPHVMNRETALTIWMMTRYAAMTGDNAWLRNRWDRVRRGVEWMRAYRALTLRDPSMPYFGLLPPGFADGGLGGVNAEYSGVHWMLTSLEAASKAARRFGENADAENWDALHAELLASWRTAAQRDMRSDAFGNRYLPARVNPPDDGTPAPQAVWMSVEPMLLTSFIPPDDPLISSTFQMLRAHESQGLVLDVGWLRGGIWAYFGAWYAELAQRLGYREKAADILYAFANHATPHATWAEEQLPNAVGPRTAGDYPHIWGASLLVRTTRMLIASEVADDLHLLHGVPDLWLAPGTHISLVDAPTLFGVLQLNVNVDGIGRVARVVAEPIDAAGSFRVDLRGFRQLGFVAMDGSDLPETFVAPMNRRLELEMKRKGT